MDNYRVFASEAMKKLIMKDFEYKSDFIGVENPTAFYIKSCNDVWTHKWQCATPGLLILAWSKIKTRLQPYFATGFAEQWTTVHEGSTSSFFSEFLSADSYRVMRFIDSKDSWEGKSIPSYLNQYIPKYEKISQESDKQEIMLTAMIKHGCQWYKRLGE